MYIGKTKYTAERRLKGHRLEVKQKSIFKIHQAIAKYGFDTFLLCVLETGVTDQQTLTIRERFYIAAYRTQEDEFGYNMTPGGDDPPDITGKKYPKEVYSSRSEAMKGNTFGSLASHNPSKEVRDRIGRRQAEHQASLTEEQRREATAPGRDSITKLRAQGKKVGGNSFEVGYGIPRSEECKKLIGDSKRGKPGHRTKGRTGMPHKQESIELMRQRALDAWAKRRAAKQASLTLHKPTSLYNYMRHEGRNDHHSVSCQAGCLWYGREG